MSIAYFSNETHCTFNFTHSMSWILLHFQLCHGNLKTLTFWKYASYSQNTMGRWIWPKVKISHKWSTDVLSQKLKPLWFFLYHCIFEMLNTQDKLVAPCPMAKDFLATFEVSKHYSQMTCFKWKIAMSWNKSFCRM